MSPRFDRIHRFRPPAIVLAIVALVTAASIADGAQAPKAAPTVPAHAKPAFGTMGLSNYQPPAAYSVDMLIHSPKAEMTMKRFIDGGKIRTEISGQSEDMVMIEMGDEKGTTYMLMPKQKRAMKQSRAAMEAMAPKKVAAAEAEGAAQPVPKATIEDLGDETMDGRVVHKLRMSVPEGSALGWFDKASGAPVRMESNVKGEATVLEWKNYKIAPQPATLFEVPKGYELTDMDEMMEKMKGMGGPGAMMGGPGAMMGGMAQGMGSSLGSSLGSSFGGGLGAALGGPLGAMAGQYLGGKVGGMIGKKAVSAVTPGK